MDIEDFKRPEARTRSTDVRAEYKREVKRVRTGEPAKKSIAQKLSFKEKLVVQLIVCGFIMLIALIINIIGNDTAAYVKKEIKLTIRESITAESVRQFWDSSAAKLEDLGEGVKTIFGFEKNEEKDSDENNGEEGKEGEDVSKVFIETTDTPTQTESAVPSDELEKVNSNSFRIDEDILNSINSSEDLYIKANGTEEIGEGVQE